MKKIIISFLTAVMLAGCGSVSFLQNNSGALAASVGSRGSTAAGSRINANVSGGITAPVFNSTESSRFSAGTDEVSPQDFADFIDFYEDGIPEDAVFPALRYAEGSWKYYLDMQDPETGAVLFNEFGLADLSLNYAKETVIIDLHPRLAGDGYELYPETDEEVGYESFEGGFDDNGALKLIGNDVIIYITSYFAWSGREYVMGEFWYSEEYYGLFLLTRGQQ